MRKAIVLVLGAVMGLAIPTLVSAEPFTGHFAGFADHTGGTPGIYAAGEQYTARLVIDPVQPKPWYPWLAGMEYTAVLSATVGSFDDSQPVWTVAFAQPGFVEIWEDNVTPADYAHPSTFTDGTLILSGVVLGMVGERYNMSGMPWAITGTIVFGAGAGLGLLETDCEDGLLMNDFVDYFYVTPPAGYEEGYDAEWKCEDLVSVDSSTWGRVKSLYR